MSLLSLRSSAISQGRVALYGLFATLTLASPLSLFAGEPAGHIQVRQMPAQLLRQTTGSAGPALTTIRQAPIRQTTHESPAPSYAAGIQQLTTTPVTGVAINGASWWRNEIHGSLRPAQQAKTISLEQLIWMAVTHSAQVQVFSELPLIREQAIVEADAAFDWSAFLDTRWNDISDPVGSSLTVGGTGNRYQNHQYDIAAGLRRKNEQGGRFEISQKLGHQNTNSTFFVPNNQGTARLALSYTHPLLRGSGEEYNRSLVVLAQIDTAAATDEFHRELQTHLLEVTRAYWGLHLERATLVQKYRLYAESTRILADLVGRAEIDANQTQIANARAAVATRRADLIRALTAVKNAESRIRGLVNAPELGDGDSVELIPLDTPTHDFLPTNLSHSMGTALQSRPEINLALREIQAACLRTHVSWNELLPVLNLVTEAYISGLQGQSDIPQAIGNQYSVGRPSYTIGIQYEVPLGNRAASARHTRRHLELRQMQSRYRSTTESIKVEVEVAVREVETAYGEMLAKYEQMLAANAEVDSIESRWKHLPGMDGNAGLILDQLLRAQERLTAAETGFSLAELTYNLSLMNLKKAEGTLIQQESISEGRIQDGDLPRTILDKPTGMVPSSFSRPQEPTLAYP